MEIQQNSLV